MIESIFYITKKDYNKKSQIKFFRSPEILKALYGDHEYLEVKVFPSENGIFWGAVNKDGINFIYPHEDATRMAFPDFGKNFESNKGKIQKVSFEVIK